MIPFEVKDVTCIATELPARVVTNSDMVGSTEVFKQRVNSKRSITKKVRRQDESTEEREARLAKKRHYYISKKQNETAEQREARLTKMREYSISRKQNETAEQREARLTKKRETVRASRKRASQKQGDRKGKCSSHQIEEHIKLKKELLIQ